MVGILSLVVHPGAHLRTCRLRLRPARPIGPLRRPDRRHGARCANTYIFSAMYGRAMEVTSAAVLLLTIVSLATVTFWLSVLP